ncbi:hypothetical protein [Paenibacillus campi]|uniref:hypothetical protein n=1 Tax=Paenibacillus campi TaxID=3106031 RepID=UPI002B001024|nr:hypothetical protein [Paenibacillus sp. SGZ-1009]
MAQIAALPPNETPLDFEILRETFKDPKLVAKIEAATLADYHALLSGSTSMKSRSERDFHIILQLLKSDVSVTDIRNIFVTFPCGDRYRENGSGDRYLITQINAAIERLNQEFSIEIVTKNFDDVEYI